VTSCKAEEERGRWKRRSSRGRKQEAQARRRKQEEQQEEQQEGDIGYIEGGANTTKIL